MKKLLSISFVLLFNSMMGSGQNLALVDSLLNSKYKSGEPGAVALIAKGGTVVYRKAFGMADLENNVTMTPGHIFEIGSITKQFTAVSVLMLLEQGKLSLEDPVTRFIENYPMHGHTITIHHLLTHTSGIKSYTSMESWTKLWRKDMKPLEMIELFKGEPMDFAPGEKYLYNNSAYFMLGYIIEKASGIPYPEFLEKNIFIPLGMKNAFYGSQSKIIKNRAQGYQKEGDYKNAEYLSLTHPYSAGSIMMNVDDLFTWHLAIQSNRLVKKETIQKAFTNYKLNNGKFINYGYGWGLNEINGSPTIEHSGGIFGYATNSIYLPREDVYLAIFSNCDCNAPGETSTRIAAIMINKPYPDNTAKIKLDIAYMKSLTGVYEFDDLSTRYITLEDSTLYSQRQGAQKLKIYPQDKLNFLFENSSIPMLQFVVDKTGVKELLAKNRINVSKGIKSNKPVPSHLEVPVSRDVLKQYAGVYEIQPNFSIEITLEDGHLMSKATGQQKNEIFPEAQTKFFYKVVDAQIEFIQDSSGKFNSLVLYQGGQKITGKRKNNQQ
jgi:CubicO group peptidase (beta-lactamase class C family)